MGQTFLTKTGKSGAIPVNPVIHERKRKLKQTLLSRPGCSGCAALDAELAEQVGDVGLGRKGADEERLADLGVGLAGRDLAQHIELALGQTMIRRRCRRDRHRH